MKNFFSRKLLAVGLGSLMLVAGVTVGVFAAIPDSNTKLITACRNNFSGALKAIDAQNGATCGLFETSLSWSGDITPPSSGGGVETAVFHPSPDSSEPGFNIVYNPTFSRGIINLKKLVANDPINNPDDVRGYCIELGFDVLYSNEFDPGGAIVYPAVEDGRWPLVDSACGPGFDAYIDGGSNLNKPVFFSE